MWLDINRKQSCQLNDNPSVKGMAVSSPADPSGSESSVR